MYTDINICADMQRINLHCISAASRPGQIFLCCISECQTYKQDARRHTEQSHRVQNI